MPFSHFSDEHAARLQAAVSGPDWQALLDAGAIDDARARMVVPARPVNVFSLPVAQLRALNEARTRELIAQGERDEDRLLDALGAWPQTWPDDLPVRLSFLGLNLGFDCDMSPRCVYCNQVPVASRVSAEDWARVVAGATPAEGEGPYLFVTGGEPLLQGEALWGDGGLIRRATQAGAACNVNTNALALTPAVALSLVSAGLSRVHISLDTHRAEVQNALCGRQGVWQQVVRGVEHLQIAKALLGAEHPTIHINCVLTRLNADDFPDFLQYLLSRKPLVPDAVSRDLDLHVIPVGGERNAHLRLSEDEYVRFFTETWERADGVWLDYQRGRGIAEDKLGPLAEKVPYLSPFHRVRQEGSLRAWASRAAAGLPAALAFARRCYVGPTQAFILPDGSQYWCGGHATSRPEPVGSVLERSVGDNIRAGLEQVGSLPGPHCRTCPGATLAINQSVERALRELIGQWLSPTDEKAAEAPGAEGFE